MPFKTPNPNGVTSLEHKSCTIVWFDLASWTFEPDELKSRLNLEPTFSWLEKVLNHSFHTHLRIYRELHAQPAELISWCLSQSDCFRPQAEAQFGKYRRLS